MNIREHLLVCLAEECVEVVHASTLGVVDLSARYALLDEIKDLFAVALALQQQGSIGSYNPQIEQVMASLPALEEAPSDLLRNLTSKASLIAQRTTKALRFGLSEIQDGQGCTNAERISQALSDFFIACIAFQERGIFGDFHPTPAAALAKLKKIERFMAISVCEGALQAN